MTRPNLFKRKLRGNDEGQVTIDYLIGITIFIVALFFIFQYSAGLFTPFQSNSDEVTLVADRVATSITEMEMSAGDIRTPNLIDSDKTDDYFDTKLSTSGYYTEIDKLGLRGEYHRYDLNVTLENSTQMLKMAGEPLPLSNNIGQTKRVVLIEDTITGKTETAILSVRVW
ncbi:hypothetical protein J7W08_07445 [Methanococcoides orientis]|uniref:DUF7287 family protein n=1 Tax=Methanococcoides orientis TaxID=2822137 RepID=UPI001E42052F|nr:hypothetical protein [Methanococcoides orientis]UGV39956.1 hypothetical protein J7W08_07445 [Methanococcoides orientis]